MGHWTAYWIRLVACHPLLRLAFAYNYGKRKYLMSPPGTVGCRHIGSFHSRNLRQKVALKLSPQACKCRQLVLNGAIYEDTNPTDAVANRSRIMR